MDTRLPVSPECHPSPIFRAASWRSPFAHYVIPCGIRGKPAARQALFQAIRIDLIGRPARRKTDGTIVLLSKERLQLGRHTDDPTLPILRRAGIEPHLARFAIDLAPHKCEDFVRQVESTVIQSDNGRIVFTRRSR